MPNLSPPPQLLFAFIGRKNSLAPRVLATFFQKRFAWTTVQRTPQNEFSLDINPILVPKLDRNAKIETSYFQFPNFGRLIMKSRAPRPLKMKVYREIIIFFPEPATHCEGYNKRQTKKAKGRKGRQVYTVFILIYTLGSGEKEDGLSPRMML